MKRRFALFLCLLLLFAPAARADGAFTVSARAACLIDAATGRILYAQNADERYPMASTTKVMTALLALENTGLDEMVTAGENASGVEGTSIYLSVGETLSMRDMLYGLMLRSGNDAAVAIAEHIAGSIEEFSGMMTRRAIQLGADAVFANPHGLPADNHEASAHAMTLIARASMQLPVFREIVSTQRATIPWVGNEYSRVLNNKNKLLSTYPGATGIKTGFTKAAGRCLVFSAEQDGMELIGCVLNCPDWFNEAARLLDHGFEEFAPETVLHAGNTISYAAITNARDPRLPLTIAEDVVLPLREGETYQLEFHPQNTAAPISAGQELGYVSVVIDMEEVVRAPLIAATSAEEWGLLPSLRKIWQNWLNAW